MVPEVILTTHSLLIMKECDVRTGNTRGYTRALLALNQMVIHTPVCSISVRYGY